MRKLIVVLFLFVVTFGYAQDIPANDDTDIYSTAELQVLPEYPGGISALYAFVTNNLRVPDVTQDLKVSIPLTFVVNQDGTVSNIKVLRNPGHGLAEEAVRMMASNREIWKRHFERQTCSCTLHASNKNKYHWK